MLEVYSSRMISNTIFLHCFHELPRVFHRDIRKYAMAEVEDMSRTLAEFFQDLPDAPANHIARRIQHRRVKIPLQCRCVPDAPFRVRHIGRPIQADDFGTCGGGRFERMTAVLAKHDDRRSGFQDLMHDPFDVLQREFTEHVGWKKTSPRIEDLYRLRPCRYLRR